MYERFTDKARAVLELANQEALLLRHEYIGTEHILLGLANAAPSIAVAVFEKLDINPEKIRNEVLKIVLPGPNAIDSGKLPQTPRAKRVIEFAIKETEELGHDYVGTEHLLLGVLREQEGVAAQVLMNLGLELQLVRQEVLSVLGLNEIPKEKRLQRFKSSYAELRGLPEQAVRAVIELDYEIAECIREKEEALAARDFDKAAQLRGRIDQLREERIILLRKEDAEEAP